MLVAFQSIRHLEIEEVRKEVEEGEEEVKEEGEEMKDGKGVKGVRMRLCCYASCKKDCE